VTRRSQSAFSLIELVVVLLIMGTVGGVIVACFMGGVRAYERSRDFGRSETDGYLALAMIEQDIRNAVVVPGIPFVGDSSMMQFASLVSSGYPGVMGVDVAVVHYGADSVHGISRLASRMGEGRAPGLPESILPVPVSMQLAFRSGTESGKASEWVDTWQSVSNLPRQVRVRLSGGELGAEGLESVLVLPSGGGEG
jgi:prepilin-type N-terminal cleavage/methylation domain-containing protein